MNKSGTKILSNKSSLGLKRNKSKLFYANVEQNKAEPYLDKYGNVLYTGDKEDYYGLPTEFKGNIVTSGNKPVEAVEFGLDSSDYHAILTISKNTYPITEGSLIWQDSEPKDNGVNAIKSSADYIVMKNSSSINEGKFILKKLVN